VRRDPRHGPPATPLERDELVERRLRYADERNVAIVQVHDHAAQPVGERRAARARNRPVLPEHQVVDEQPRAPVEQLGQRLRPVLGREAVLLLDRDPRQLAPLLLDAPRVLLELPLGGQQLLACRLPLLLRADLHRTSFVLT